MGVGEYMQNLMIDIEALGTNLNAPLMSIGAVRFDLKTGETGDTFHELVNLNDSLCDSTVDGDTVYWWLQQSEEARADVIGLPSQRLNVSTILSRLEHFYNGELVWSKPANFDIAILEHLYYKNGMGTPWDRRSTACLRTLEKLIGGNVYKEFPHQNGTQHNALDDAIHQAKYASFLYNKLMS